MQSVYCIRLRGSLLSYYYLHCDFNRTISVNIVHQSRLHNNEIRAWLLLSKGIPHISGISITNTDKMLVLFRTISSRSCALYIVPHHIFSYFITSSTVPISAEVVLLVHVLLKLLLHRLDLFIDLYSVIIIVRASRAPASGKPCNCAHYGLYSMACCMWILIFHSKFNGLGSFLFCCKQVHT